MNKSDSSYVRRSRGTSYIKKQVQKSLDPSLDDELMGILDNEDDKSLKKFNEDYDKIKKWREIIKKVVFPLLRLQEFIGDITEIKKHLTDISRWIAEKDESSLNDAKQSLEKILKLHKSDANVSDMIAQLVKVNWNISAKYVISIIRSIYSNQDNPMLLELISILESESGNITLKWSMATWNFEEIPSFDVFVDTISMEIAEYLKKLNFLWVSWDDSVISSILIWQWLKEQKSSSYIRLPFFDDMIKKIEKSKRNWKVGQVVLKWPPGTWKTRIFEYFWEKLWRPLKVISMHEYINFYELLIQSTNLSPSKNQIDFIDTIIKNYKEIGGEELLHELEVLFEKNRDKFPWDYKLVNFINNIFDSSKYIWNSPTRSKLESVGDIEAVSKFVIDSLTYWKNEKIFTLLLNKKEIIEWELLSCISNWEIPVLDEIDKVKEKEVNWILAFLDLETWRSHKVQWMDREVFIPEWFWVYATSNDDLKPSGPLGRRFNSVHFDYLDLENMTLYLVSRIVDNELSCPFDNKELMQISDCLTMVAKLIEENKQWAYSFLDFSMRLLDNFINWFIQIKDWTVQKKSDIWNKDTYIYEALKNAFEMQTEDVYGNKSLKNIQMKELWEQKNAVLKIIDNRINNVWSGSILSWTRLSKWVRARVNSVLRKMDLNNILLKLIVKDKNDKYSCEESDKARILNFSEQVSRILGKSDDTLRGIIHPWKNRESSIFTEGTKIFSANSNDVKLEIEFDGDSKTMEVRADASKIKFSCKSIEECVPGRKYLIDQWEDMGWYMTIDMVPHMASPVIYTNLSDKYKSKNRLLKGAFYHNWQLIWINEDFNGNKFLSIWDEEIDSSEEEIKCRVDENGLFFIVNKIWSVSIIPAEEKDAFTRFFANLTYDERLMKWQTLLSLSLNDFWIPDDWESAFWDIRFDSTYEYLFVDIVSKWETTTNTIKI
ncbi:MAG: hypothetical protein ACD_2C00212G0004 [uncultured bacterium (gcode 4)]|uniref:Uncharacterized protein n=1 Tax=uncultured bacterium (gcode 4) TaxID=1234023 RepID=K2GFU0_9BACT|nr:MAG: hypothetical protein ACD_2C00212G0004 [uncultured bacterium (gcode 4)]